MILHPRDRPVGFQALVVIFFFFLYQPFLVRLKPYPSPPIIFLVEVSSKFHATDALRLSNVDTKRINKLYLSPRVELGSVLKTYHLFLVDISSNFRATDALRLSNVDTKKNVSSVFLQDSNSVVS